jgi:hypothetical protein
LAHFDRRARRRGAAGPDHVRHRVAPRDRRAGAAVREASVGPEGSASEIEARAAGRGDAGEDEEDAVQGDLRSARSARGRKRPAGKRSR